MSKIVFLLTTTPWSDRRQYIRQAPALRAGGHDIVYMTGLPDKKLKEDFKFVNISVAQRKLSRLMGATNLFFKVKRASPEVIQLCSIEQLPLGLLLKAFTRIKVIYDCREDMAPSLLQHRDSVPKVVRVILYHSVNILERLAALMFDGIVTADPFVYEKHNRMPETRKMVFYNAAQLRDFNTNYPKLLDRDYDLVIMGSMSPRTGVLDVITAVGELHKEGRDIKLLLLGKPDASVSDVIDQRLNEYDIKSLVTITGKIEHKKVPSVLATARIGVVPLLDFEKFRNNIACKAFEYMACGMPCICSDLRPQRLFISDPDNGRFYDPGDVKKLKKNVEELLADDLMMQKIGDRNRSLVEEKWNAELFESEYVTFYKYIIDNPRGKH